VYLVKLGVKKGPAAKAAEAIAAHVEGIDGKAVSA